MTDSTAAPTTHWAVRQSDHLELEIVLTTGQPLAFEKGIPPYWLREKRLDPVALWLAGAERGMWGGGEKAYARLVGRECDPNQQRTTWLFGCQDLELEALGVLANLLNACLPTEISIQGRKTTGDLQAPLTHAPPALPAMPTDTPFDLILDPPLKSSVDRCIVLEWRDTLNPEQVREVYRDLHLWLDLVNGGGFPDESGHSGVLIGAPMMDDAWSVVLPVPIFRTDEAAWATLVRYALFVNRDRPLNAVRIY